MTSLSVFADFRVNSGGDSVGLRIAVQFSKLCRSTLSLFRRKASSVVIFRVSGDGGGVVCVGESEVVKRERESGERERERFLWG